MRCRICQHEGLIYADQRCGSCASRRAEIQAYKDTGKITTIVLLLILAVGMFL